VDLTAQAMSTTPPTSTLTMNDSGMDVDTPDSASTTAIDQTSHSVPMGVEGEELTNVDTVAAPAWLNALKMDSYLQDCSDAKAWRALVQTLYKFELGNTVNGVGHFNCITGYLSYLTISIPVESTDNFTS
jgi:hypothetical protein